MNTPRAARTGSGLRRAPERTDPERPEPARPELERAGDAVARLRVAPRADDPARGRAAVPDEVLRAAMRRG